MLSRNSWRNFEEKIVYKKYWELFIENSTYFKGTVKQIEKTLKNDRYVFQKYPENLAFQLFIILQ